MTTLNSGLRINNFGELVHLLLALAVAYWVIMGAVALITGWQVLSNRKPADIGEACRSPRRTKPRRRREATSE